MNNLKLNIKNENDPAMRYEFLARAAFNCDSKYCDPFSYAAQDQFSKFVNEDDMESYFQGKKALSTMLIVLVYRFPNSNTITEELKNLIDRTWEAKTQDEVIKIINKAIELGIKLNL